MPFPIVRRLGAAALALAASAALAGPAQGAVTHAGDDPLFPTWFADDTGLRLEECTDPACAPVAGEHIWYSAEAAVGATQNAPGATLGIGIDGHDADAVEPAITGGELLLDAHDLTPNGTYTITHPYGTDTVQADAQGRLNNEPLEGSAGCAPAAVGDPCNPDDVNATAIGPFLRPANATPGAQGDLIGDGATAGPVVGSPAGTNLFRIQGPGGIDLQTTQFIVLGQINQEAAVGIDSVTPRSLTFASRTVGTTSSSQSVTVANVGFNDLTVTAAPALSGANAGDFSITSGCPLTPDVLGVPGTGGSACSIAVTFTPSAAGTRTATLTIPTDGPDGSPATTGTTRTVSLTGTGAVPAPAARTTPSAPVSSVTTGSQQQAPRPANQPGPVLAPALNRVGVPSRLTLRSVRSRGITLRLGSVTVSRVLVRIRRGNRVVYRRTVATGNQVRLNERILRRLMRRGRYHVQLTPIAASGQRGAAITRRLTISR
jgi:hypothetical protein